MPLRMIAGVLLALIALTKSAAHCSCVKPAVERRVCRCFLLLCFLLCFCVISALLAVMIMVEGAGVFRLTSLRPLRLSVDLILLVCCLAAARGTPANGGRLRGVWSHS